MEDLARCPGIGERKVMLFITKAICLNKHTLLYSALILTCIFILQVKRLHDTFHEPFKRVVSSHPPVPETPVSKEAEPFLVTEVTEADKSAENSSKKKKKEPEVTVKSAVSAAFAKYADKIGKKNSSPGKKKGEATASKSDDKDLNGGEGPTS